MHIRCRARLGSMPFVVCKQRVGICPFGALPPINNCEVKKSTHFGLRNG